MLMKIVQDNEYEFIIQELPAASALIFMEKQEEYNIKMVTNIA